MNSTSTENFIKALYNFEQDEGRDTRMGSIARELGISSAAATDKARKLAMKKLVDYERYKELKLTPAGRKMALGIVRKHRLWESFLHRVFGLSMHEIHREAELLEHQTSDFLADKICLYLGNPSTDPHGDPIPDEKGIFPADMESVLLSSAPQQHEYEICRLTGSGKEYFEFCHLNHLRVGSRLTLKRQFNQNQMTEIEVRNTRILLNSDMTGTIHVRKIKKGQA